jgi:hypothetical protein
MAALEFMWLKKGGKFSSFDKHRQFLPLDHAFRGDTKNFTKGITMTGPVTQKMTTAQVHAQIEALVLPTQKDNPKKGKRKKLNPKKDKPKKDHFVGYGEKHMCTQKLGLERLSCCDDLLLPHSIDVMHNEKNVAEALWATLMDIPEKKKDNPKARVDVATLCHRPKLHMMPPRDGKLWKRPKVDYVLEKKHMIEVIEWMQTLSFLMGLQRI